MSAARAYAKKTQSKKNKDGSCIAIDICDTKEDDKVATHKFDKEKITIHRANYISIMTMQQISIKTNFSIKNVANMFLICAELLALLILLKTIDPNLKVLTSIGDTIWTDFTEL
eukprot:8835800-Ditylum_brightwellii.AAC.1